MLLLLLGKGDFYLPNHWNHGKVMMMMMMKVDDDDVSMLSTVSQEFGTIPTA